MRLSSVLFRVLPSTRNSKVELAKNLAARQLNGNSYGKHHGNVDDRDAKSEGDGNEWYTEFGCCVINTVDNKVEGSHATRPTQ